MPYDAALTARDTPDVFGFGFSYNVVYICVDVHFLNVSKVFEIS